MNKFINKTIILALVVSIFSCTELEEDPIGLYSPDLFFKTTADIETAVLGAYAHIANEQFYGRKLVLSLLLRGDMADIGDRNTPGRRQQVNDFDMDSNNGMITAFWPRAYRIIGAANAGLKGVEVIGETSEKISELEGEALFLRAFTYYHLVRIFGDIPYIETFIENPDDVADISKTSASEVYDNIIADLQFAKDNLPDSYPNDVRSRPTKGTAAAYLASVHLTQGNHQQAYDEAKWVIDNKDQFGYALEENFADLYNAEIADELIEHIFSVDFKGQVNSGNENTDWMAPITGIRSVFLPGINEGWSVAVPTLEVFTTWDDRDYRREVSFIDSAYLDEDLTELFGYDKFAPNHGSARPHIGKYWRNAGNHRGDGGYSDNNYSAMRYAEVLLIAAEALNEINSGPNAEAEGYVNEIRQRARNWNGTMTSFPEDVTSGMNQADFQDLLIEERRLELAFEFKRWYDIKRLQIGEAVFTEPGSLEPHPKFDPDRDYLFPLPEDELLRNENLLPQNTGY